MMNIFLKLVVGLLFIFALTGCIAEDYDVGVPTAHILYGSGLSSVQLTEANVSWNTASEDVQQTIGDIQELGLTQDKLKVSPNQEASLDFKENEENGGDIWTDPTITVSLWKDDQHIEVQMNELREFQFPTNKGNYVIEVTFINSAGSAQYVGNIVIE